MAKRGRKRGSGSRSTEARIEGFAEDLGRLLGTARAKADTWLGQRQQIAKTLEGIRDTATGLLRQLGHQAQKVTRRRPGRPPKNATAVSGSAPGKRRRRRKKASAATRAAMSKAQTARWAKQKAANAK